MFIITKCDVLRIKGPEFFFLVFTESRRKLYAEPDDIHGVKNVFFHLQVSILQNSSQIYSSQYFYLQYLH